MKNEARNSSYMKMYNQLQILNLIRKEPISRAEIARRTGLTRAAISIIIDNLESKGLVVETGAGEADFGRKPVLLDVNPGAFYAVGLDISREGYSIGLVDIKGQLVEKRRVGLPASDAADEALEVIAGEIIKLMDGSGISRNKFLGVGISAPGPLDALSGKILNPPNFHKWHGICIVDELKKKVPLDIFLDNNSIAHTLAEKNFGSGTGFGSFMVLVVDTGIGAGIILADKIYRGVGGFGSEVGHTSIHMDGRPCSCGNKGCLETYASIPAILGYAGTCDPELKSWNGIVDRAIAGDEVCTGIIEFEARCLSAGIVNVMNVLELEAVILTGYISYRPEMLLEEVRKNIYRTAITRDIHKLKVLNSSIPANADVISAATIAIEKFFSGEIKRL